MSQLRTLSHKALTWTQDIGLVIIAISTLIAIGFEIDVMITAGKVTLADLLLLFIYLEILAMIAIYMDSGKLPVRMPLYIAIVALARYLILDMKDLDKWEMLSIGGTTVLIAITILIIRYGHTQFPYQDRSDD